MSLLSIAIRQVQLQPQYHPSYSLEPKGESGRPLSKLRIARKEKLHAISLEIGEAIHATILTAEENLRFFGRLHHLPDLNQRIEAELRRADLWSRRRDPARIFSRGMQQRLSIARALLPSPSLLLLDEPYTGLDPDSARTLDATLRQVVADGCTVIFTSHDWLRSVELASRVDVLAGGRMAISLPVEGLPLPELLQTLQEAAAQ